MVVDGFRWLGGFRSFHVLVTTKKEHRFLNIINGLT